MWLLIKFKVIDATKPEEVVDVTTTEDIVDDMPTEELVDVATTEERISPSLLKTLSEGKLANVLICVKIEDVEQKFERSLTGTEDLEDEIDTEEKRIAFYEKSSAPIVELLEKEKGRLAFTWTLLPEKSRIIVKGADLKLVEDIATIENATFIDEDQVVQGKVPKIWKRLKSIMKPKK